MRKEISVLGPTSSSCGGRREMLPTKEILRSHALLRTCFFFFFSAWEVVWGKILTIDILMRRGWIMVKDVAFTKTAKKQVIF